MILIIDDECDVREALSDVLREEGYDVLAVETGEQAEEALRTHKIGFIMLDQILPDVNGIDFLEHIKQSYPSIRVIMITAHATVKMAVDAIKKGADDVIEKPLDISRVILTLKRVKEKAELEEETKSLKNEILNDYPLLGDSSEMKAIRRMIENTAPTEASVLITGETGTGKEIVSRNIFIKSKRASKPFIKLNCAALPGELIESELFGYEKGAFTGAVKQQTGKFEYADGGTIFLDEIGDMTLQTQAKILRILDSGEMYRIGGNREIKVNVRIIAATNKNLIEEIKEKKFRQDLYHRLNVINIRIPSLRDRKEDIPALVSYFINIYCMELNKQVIRLSSKHFKALETYDYPGNVRELKHLIEKVLVFDDTDIIFAYVNHGYNIPEIKSAEGSLVTAVGEFEKQYIMSILEQNRWNITKTAEKLGVDRTTLYRKMKQYGLQ